MHLQPRVPEQHAKHTGYRTHTEQGGPSEAKILTHIIGPDARQNSASRIEALSDDEALREGSTRCKHL